MRISDFIKDISPYIPGKPIEELKRNLRLKDVIKLASNENPLGPSKKALKEIKKGLNALNRYPDGSCYYLKNILSKKLKVHSDELLIGNGSNEILDIATKTFLMPGDNAVMAKPSFVVYSMATKITGAEPIEMPLTEGMTHDLMAMTDAVNRKTKIVFIANPNNPTGTINKRDEFREFMKRIPEDVLVIVDEAYYEYVEDKNYPDTIEYLREGYSIMILRTFSKIYGLAGLRIGYAIADREIISYMNKVREPFNVNSLAQLAAIGALKDTNHIRTSLSLNKRQKEFLYKELKKLNIDFIPTEANFIYMRFPFDVDGLYKEFLKKGVIIRPIGKKEIRVTIGLKEENIKFIKAFKEIIAGRIKWT